MSCKCERVSSGGGCQRLPHLPACLMAFVLHFNDTCAGMLQMYTNEQQQELERAVTAAHQRHLQLVSQAKAARQAADAAAGAARAAGSAADQV